MAKRNTYRADERLENPFNSRHMRRAFVYILRHLLEMLTALLLSAGGAVASLFCPMIVQHALDTAIPEKNIPQLLLMCALLMASYSLSVLLTTIRSRMMVKVSETIIYDIRRDLFAHLQLLPFEYYDSRPQGKILIRVVNYVNSVSEILSNGLINVILEIINLIFIVVFMLIVDVELSLIVLAGVPFLAAFLFWIKAKQRKAWQVVSNKSSNLNAYLQENIQGVRVTQAFAREEKNHSIFRDLASQHRQAWMTAVKYSNLVWPGINSISVIVRACIFAFGLVVFAGAKSFGVIVAISSYANRFWQPIMNLGNIFNNFINNMAYLERIFETMDEPVRITDREGAAEIGPVRGDVTFEHVTFSYEEGKEVLKDLSFSVKAGESVALVGPTGAGKSTIVNLLSRFYDLQSGRILIDGKDISSVTLHSLRSSMGIMMQDSFIFSGTVRSNILYGRPDADEKAVEAAADTVCAGDFIRGLSDGFDTQVGERGGLLSQGQKQLISFARTLLSDPAILILDEATSSIDAKTEEALQRGIRAMLEGRTSFIIAHRLSTVRNCDRIFYIDNGGIVESGTHEELMARRGPYWQLCTSQNTED